MSAGEYVAPRVGNGAVRIWLYAGKAGVSRTTRMTSDTDVYDSDNVTGAENQQERLIEFRGWVIGFVDGEGCFSIGLVRQRDRAGRRGYRDRIPGLARLRRDAGREAASTVSTRSREFFGVGR